MLLRQAAGPQVQLREGHHGERGLGRQVQLRAACQQYVLLFGQSDVCLFADGFGTDACTCKSSAMPGETDFTTKK